MDISVSDKLIVLLVIFTTMCILARICWDIHCTRRDLIREGYNWAAKRRAEGWDWDRIDASRFNTGMLDAYDPSAPLFDLGIVRYLEEHGTWLPEVD